MYIVDRLYGSYELEAVIEELINTEAVQRLKHIHQNGASYLVNPAWNNTRYDHSIGVMLLIRKLGGTLEEQIAGLLHDVSHTAFSHVVDHVLEHEDEDYHEQIKESIIMDSEIPDILLKYNNDLNKILDESIWKILEQPAPHLCADRIDYTLRDLYEYGKISKREAEKFVESLKTINGKIHVTSLEAGEWFVQAYYAEVLDFFLHPLNVYSNHKMASILKTALVKEILDKEDFLKTDGEVLEILENSRDEELMDELKKLNVRMEGIENTIHVRQKIRMIDPDFHDGVTSKPLSECSAKVQEMNKEAKSRALEGTTIRI